MLSAHIAAHELARAEKRRRDEQSAEFARQLPLRQEEIAYWPPSKDVETETNITPHDEPNRHDWASFY